MKKFWTQVFHDTNGTPSYKRILGISAFIWMCIISLIDIIKVENHISDFVYDSFMWIIISSIGGSAIELFGKSKIKTNNQQEQVIEQVYEQGADTKPDSK